MYYVSSHIRHKALWGITDTEDGVTEFYTKADILKYFGNVEIKGVNGTTIKVVQLDNVLSAMLSGFENAVRSKIMSFSADTCMELARTAHFVKAIKGLDDIDEIRRITADKVYPDNIRDVVKSATGLTTELIEVDTSDISAVKGALLNNVCLVLQHKTNGVLTAFICTASLKVLDTIYFPGFFDALYLTKQLYGYTYGIEKLRLDYDDSETKKEKYPNLLNVFSCSLRFRKDGVHHDGDKKVLSSPFYSVNTDRLLAMFILNNPYRVGDSILPEFQYSKNKDDYNFDFDMYNEVRACIAGGTNLFGNEDTFLKYVDTANLTKQIDLTAVMQRFQRDFDYMTFLRQKGFSFKVGD